ncbi:MAG: cupin domain-containing protein [Deltaproteobacteria bacterium]|nr:cupin domain-containing protein [Deltaproteobacteria bacterium]
MKIRDAQYWVRRLQLTAHPEGGYYRETYRSDLIIPASALGGTFKGPRNVSTAIYFLLEKKQCSAFHRIRSDELWHFHMGDSLLIHIILDNGTLQSQRLGPHIESGDAFQVVVPKGCWFAAEVLNPESYSLCSCTVAPGFAFDDFELADPEHLAKTYPQYMDLIKRMQHAASS